MNTRLTTLAVVLAVAFPAALAAQNAFSTLSGSIVDQSGASLPGVALFAAMGAALLANGALRLPRGARLRGKQMDAIAADLVLPLDRSAHDPG